MLQEQTSNKEHWKHILQILNSGDFANVWVGDVKEKFYSVEEETGRVVFFLEKLLAYYKKDKTGHSREISEIDNLISKIKKGNVAELDSLMYGDEFKMIFNQEQIDLFRRKVDYARKIYASVIVDTEDKAVGHLEDEVVRLATEATETDLVPAKVRGRTLWIPATRTAQPLKEELKRIRKIRIWLASLSGKKMRGREDTGKLEKIKIYREKLRKIIERARALMRAKKLSRKVMINFVLVPMISAISLLGSASGISTATLPTEEEMRRELAASILGPNSTPSQLAQTMQMLKASEFMERLMDILNKNKSGDIPYDELPDYIKSMISDGVLDIALLAGADLENYSPIKQAELEKGQDVSVIRFAQRDIVLRIRYIDKIEEAKKAAEEADVIHWNAHSRHGLGIALRGEGMGNPLRMQTHPVKLTKEHLYGYKGRILKDLGNGEVLVEASDEDISDIIPKKGYQLWSMDSCSSGPYFLEIMKRLRKGLPTTIIYSNDFTYGDHTEIILKGLFAGKPIEQITSELNKTIPNLYHAIVLNTDYGSPQSTAYDKYNIAGSVTMYYDVQSPRIDTEWLRRDIQRWASQVGPY